MKVLKSTGMKARLSNYLMGEKHHIAVVTEGLNQSDVLGVTGALFGVEYEIKTSRPDLKLELDSMIRGQIKATVEIGDQQAQLALITSAPSPTSKLSKHRQYFSVPEWLVNKRQVEYDWRTAHTQLMWHNAYIPNYYNFLVTKELVPYALERLQGLPYGVATLDCRHKYKGKSAPYWHMNGCTESCYDEIAVVKPAKRLHGEPLATANLVAIMRRASWENVELRRKNIAQQRRLHRGENISVFRGVNHLANLRRMSS